MNITKEDYLRLIRTGKLGALKPPKRVEADAANLRHMTQAAVAMKDLTGTQSWDLFLRYLQSAKEAWIKERDDVLLGLMSATNDVEGKRLQAARLDERARLVDVIIGLPSQLIESGDEAKTLTERMEEDAERQGAIGKDREDHSGAEAA